MTNKAGYAFTVLVTVGALSYLLRALPFLLFGGRKEPPQIVRYVGRMLSPAAIAMLVVYCFAGLSVPEIKTPITLLAPYLAGALTIALQLWKRNPLISILLGTVLYMALVQ